MTGLDGPGGIWPLVAVVALLAYVLVGFCFILPWMIERDERRERQRRAAEAAEREADQ